jgi:AraC-like DNA-binding protein
VERVTVNTADVSESERFEYWRNMVAATFVPLRCDPPGDFAAAAFNGRLRSLRFDAFQATEVSVTPHLVVRSRTLIARSAGEFYKISMQLEGTCVLTQDDREAPLRPGDFAVYDTTRPYSIRLAGPYRTLVFLVPRHRLRIPPGPMADITARTISGRCGMGALLSPFLRRFAAGFGTSNPIGSERLADNIVDLVDTLLAEHLESVPTCWEAARRVLLLRILEYMESRLGDPDLDAEQIAAAHYISPRYLYKLLHGEGIAVAAWIRGQRLERCRRDLRDPLLADRTVSAIAGRWGFTDAAHFSRVYRSAYGVSPREYRARGQGIK